MAILILYIFCTYNVSFIDAMLTTILQTYYTTILDKIFPAWIVMLYTIEIHCFPLHYRLSSMGWSQTIMLQLFDWSLLRIRPKETEWFIISLKASVSGMALTSSQYQKMATPNPRCLFSFHCFQQSLGLLPWWFTSPLVRWYHSGHV